MTGKVFLSEQKAWCRMDGTQRGRKKKRPYSFIPGVKFLRFGYPDQRNRETTRAFVSRDDKVKKYRNVN